MGPLLPIAVLAGVGLLLFGKKGPGSVSPTVPSNVTPTVPGGGGSSPYVPPDGGGGPTPGSAVPGSTPGDVYIGPGGTDTSGGDLGGASVATGTSPDPSLSDLFSSSGPMVGAPLPHGSQWVWSHHARAWVRPYPGWREGNMPPRGLPAHRPY